MKEEYLQSGEERIVLPDTDASVDPLNFEDVEGSFYLLGAGIVFSCVVHLLMIIIAKLKK